MNQKNCIIQSKSGSGKTLSYLIPCIESVDKKLNQTQVLILCHTRGLAQQINYVCLKISSFLKIQCVSIVGGLSVKNDIKQLELGP